jgi:NADH:ubiquinone oxidoreductase subunit E
MDEMTRDEKLEQLDAFIHETSLRSRSESYLIAVLHRAQAIYGHLSREVMDHIAFAMNVSTAHVWGVATFYRFFNLSPTGRHVVSVCQGTACYLRGARAILDTVKSELSIELGQTTKDGLFTLAQTRCVGTCGLAPAMTIDDTVYGELTPGEVIDILRSYKEAASRPCDAAAPSETGE